MSGKTLFPSIVNPLRYADGYHSGVYAQNADTLNQAIAAIGSDLRVLLLQPGTWEIDTADVDVPANIRIMLDRDAVFNVAAGRTLTLRGGMDMEDTLRRYFTGPGAVIVAGQADQVLRPQWFGAVADGVTDNLAAIQKAVETVRRSGGGTLYFSKGEYAVSDRIGLISNLAIKGDGRGLTILKPTADVSGFTALNIFIGLRDFTFAPGDAPDYGSAYYGPHYNISIEDMTIYGPVDDTRPRGGGAVRIQYVYGLRVRRVNVMSASDEGIRVDGYGAGPFVFDASDPFWGNAADVTIEDCHVEDAYVGIELEGGVNNAIVQNNTVQNCVRGLRSTSSYKSVWTHNKVLGLKLVTHHGAPVVDPIGMMSQQSRDIIFSENYIDATAADVIAMSFSTTERGKFLNNYVKEGFYSEATGTGFTTAFPDDIEFRGNFFQSTGITVDGQNNVVFRLRKSRRMTFDENTFITGKALINDTCTGMARGNRGTIVNERTADFFVASTVAGDNSDFTSGLVKVSEDRALDLEAARFDNVNAGGGILQTITAVWRFLGAGFAREAARIRVRKTADFTTAANRDGQMDLGAAENDVMVDAVSILPNRVTIRAGLVATPNANLGGMLKSSGTNTQSVGAGETDLHSLVIPANTFGANRHAVQLLAEGSFAANANGKTLRVYFNGAVIFNTGSLAINSSVWRIVAMVTRLDNATLLYSVKMDCPDPLLTQALSFTSLDVAGIDWTVAITFKITGQATTTGDIRQKSSKYIWHPDGL